MLQRWIDRLTGLLRRPLVRVTSWLGDVWAALTALTLLGLVVSALSLTVFALIAERVTTGAADPLDQRWMVALEPWRTDALTAWMRALSFIGSGNVEIPFGILVTLGLRWLGRRRAAAFYAWVTLSGWAMNGLTKALFHRVRPNIIPRLAHAGWYSFPSGHAMLAPLVLGLAVLILVRHLPSRLLRGIALTAVSLLILGIAFSRVYLGVHYPTDVVAALFAGSAWAALWVLALRTPGRPARESPPPISPE